MEELYWEVSGELDGVSANYLLKQMEHMEGIKHSILSHLASLVDLNVNFRYRGRHESSTGDLTAQIGKEPCLSDEHIWRRDVSYQEGKKAVREILGEEVDFEGNEEIQNFDLIY